MSFTLGSSISINSNGGMIIRNGSQVIKMGREGMVIENSNGQQIVMNSGGIHIHNRNSHVFVNSTFSNGTINIQTSFKNNSPTYENQGNITQSPTTDISPRESSVQPREQMSGFNYQITNNNMMWHLNQFQSFPEPDFTRFEYYPRPETSQRKRLTKAQINQLPVNLYNGKAKKIKQSLEKKGEKKDLQCSESSCNEVCAVCIFDYKIGDKLKTLPCQHKFHKACIDKWLALKSDCPICKFDLIG